MTLRLIRRVPVMVVAAGVMLATGTGMATAQARTTAYSSHTGLAAAGWPYGCTPSPSICFYTGDSWTGTIYPLTPSVYAGTWLSFRELGMPVNPGSVVDNSGSCVDEWSNTLNNSARQDSDDSWPSLDHSYGYFYIQYGNKKCTGPVPPNPP